MLSPLIGPYSLLSRRDDIILRELLHRGMSAKEFSGLLYRPPRSSYRIRQRANALARAAVGSGKTLEFASLVGAALSTSETFISQV